MRVLAVLLFLSACCLADCGHLVASPGPARRQLSSSALFLARATDSSSPSLVLGYLPVSRGLHSSQDGEVAASYVGFGVPKLRLNLRGGEEESSGEKEEESTPPLPRESIDSAAEGLHIRCGGCNAPVVRLESAFFVQCKSVNCALVIELSDLKAPHKRVPGGTKMSVKPFKRGEIHCGICDKDLGNVQDNVWDPLGIFGGKEVGLLKHKHVKFPLLDKFLKLSAGMIRSAVGEGASCTQMSTDVVQKASQREEEEEEKEEGVGGGEEEAEEEEEEEEEEDEAALEASMHVLENEVQQKKEEREVLQRKQAELEERMRVLDLAMADLGTKQKKTTTKKTNTAAADARAVPPSIPRRNLPLTLSSPGNHPSLPPSLPPSLHPTRAHSFTSRAQEEKKEQTGTAAVDARAHVISTLNPKT